MNSEFTVKAAELIPVGAGLARPECVLAFASGSLLVSHLGVGATALAPDGAQRLVGPAASADPDFLPNGISLTAEGNLLVANIGPQGGVWEINRSGRLAPVYAEADGVPLRAANFVFLDQAGRTWITVSTIREPRFEAYDSEVADGFVCLVRDGRAHIVADGLGFTNEVRLSPDGRHLYVSETFARRVSRYPVAPDGSLGARETFTAFGRGTFPDGLAFDAAGHLWLTGIVSNQIFRIAPSGEPRLVLEDADAAFVDDVETALAAGQMRREHLYRQAPGRLPNIASIAFGGSDLRTAYLGSLLGDRLLIFRSPVPGAALPHWRWTP